MFSILKKIKNVNQYQKFIVFKYIKLIESTIILYNNIPETIKYLCLLYFHQHEIFTKHGLDIKVHNNKMTISKIKNNNNWNNTSYGNIWIDSSINQIIEWKFLINKLNYNEEKGILIGIVTSDKQLNTNTFVKNNNKYKPNYAFSDDGCRLSLILNDNRPLYSIKTENKQPKITISSYKAFIGKDFNKKPQNKFWFYENDTIKIKLNTKTKQMYFKRNNENTLLIIENIYTHTKIKYKIAMTLFEKFTQISLIDFQQKLI